MKEYNILVLENMIKTFSIVGAGQECNFIFSLKGQESPLRGISNGDKVIGYVSSPKEMFCYIFEVKEITATGDYILVKEYEATDGFLLENAEQTVKDIILGTGQEKSFINITKEMYNYIIKSMFQCMAEKYINADDEEQIDWDSLFKMKNKEFAFETINILKKYNGFTEENIDIMLSREESSRTLKNTYAILREVPENYSKEELSELTKDNTGRYRYYSDVFNIKDKKYVITNDWYNDDKDNRTPYVDWIKTIINKKIQNNTEELHNEEKNIDEEINKEIIVTANKINVPYNYLVFGAPGTGKSNDLKEKVELYFKDEESYERVTFYSNYSYQQFVGTYKPKMNGNEIVYNYAAGPFIRTLVKALKNPQKNYLLIVEEINRANPAAVFGDIFQLLDRKNGRSEYQIEASEDLREYLVSHLISGYNTCRDENIKKKALDKYKKIYIPSNMYIWATMNSADQGVFPMDTAFKRRWDFKYIGIDNNQEKIKDKEVQLGSTGKMAKWNTLRVYINKLLIKCKINEDKLIGPFFLGLEVLDDNEKFNKAFKSKLLMYLYEDAARQHRNKIFKAKKFSTYSELCKAFDRDGIDIFEDIKDDSSNL